jgi:uncharacterized repeat protein (TIGR01451 family)
MTVSRLAGALLGLVLLLAGPQPASAQIIGEDAAIETTGGGPKTVGQSVSFTVTARNAGSPPLPGTLFTVNDNIQAPLTGPVTASGSNWACTVTGLQVSCHYTGGMVLPGASLPPITIMAVAGSPGSYNTCARVVLGAVPDSNPGNNEECAGGVIQPAVSLNDVGVETALNGPSVVGQATTFTLSPYNVGPTPVGSANAVQVIDVLSANFSAPITASGLYWTCSVSGQMATCTYTGPSVGSGGSLPAITLTAMTRLQGPWRNCARIGLRGQDVNMSNNEDCLPGEAGGESNDGRRTDIGIRKSGPAVVASGQQATFTLSPFNAGPSTVSGSSGIRVTDLLPPNFVGPVTATGSYWTCTLSGSGPYLVTCDYFGGPVPPNGLLPPITITATAKDVGGWSNCADIALKSGKDANERNNQSCTGGEVRPGKPADGP